MPYVHARLLASNRRNSEDRAEVFESPGGLVVVVADGAGGVRGGAAASDTLVEAMRAAIVDGPLADLAETQLAEVFRDVDSKLAGRMAGETTGVAIMLGPDRVVGVSAGDSEAWVVGEGGIDVLTAGQRKARLGSGRAQPIPFRRRNLDGVLVVGTDGLFKYASAGAISSAADEGHVVAVADKLVSLVRLPSGSFQDDVGVVVVREARR